MHSARSLGRGDLGGNDLNSTPFMASNMGMSARSPFDPKSDAFIMESEDHLDIATVARPRFMW